MMTHGLVSKSIRISMRVLPGLFSFVDSVVLLWPFRSRTSFLSWFGQRFCGVA